MDHCLNNKDLCLKLLIIYYTSLNNKLKVNNDPIPLLINKFADVQSFLEEKNLTKILYFNLDTVHKVLYDYDQIITISDAMENDLCFNYYLFLLIKAGEEIINYEFSKKYINLFKLKIKDNKYYNIIAYKIIIEFINNFRNCNLYDEDKDYDFVTKLDNESREYIKNNLNIFHDIKLNLTCEDIIERNIDELYVDIIVALMKNNKFYDYEYTLNIFNQLDLENIDIQFYSSEKLWNIILESLNSKNDYIKINDINDFDDLNDMNKINFYYFLFKYVLKSPFYMYNIPFLSQLRKKVIEILKLQEYITFTISNEIYIQRIEYIIKRLCDLDYYYIHYYLNKKKSTKSGGYTNIKSSMMKNSQCIFNVSIKGKNNIKIDKIECIYGHKQSISLEEMKKLQEKNMDFNNIINLNFNRYLNCIHMFKNIIENLKNNYQFKYNFKLYFNFKKQIMNNIINNIYNINVEYSVQEHPFYKTDMISSDENILIKKPNEFNGLISLMSKLNLEKNNEINDTYSIISIEPNITFGSSLEEIEDFMDYKIIQLDNLIYKHSESVKFFLILKNGYFLSCGNSGEIILYNQDFKILLKKDNFDDILYHITEINDYKENIELIACYGQYVYELLINKTNYKVVFKKYEVPKKKTLYCEKIKDDEYVIAGINGAIKVIDMFNDSIDEKMIYNLLEFSVKTGLVINHKYVVLISNELIPKGLNKLVICNLFENKAEYSISDYSFNLSENSLSFITLDKSSNILLCAIKKYKSNQKNGILVVDMNLVRGKDLQYRFYDSGNFQPYCFCQLFKSSYILVGGHDLNKRSGMIRMYNINNNINDLMYIQDIEITEDEIDNKFDMPVNNIVQIKETGKLIITCLDGYIFLFSKPNLDYYNKKHKG